jgi:hypothetical protein
MIPELRAEAKASVAAPPRTRVAFPSPMISPRDH